MGRLELHCTLYSRPRSGLCEAVDLRLFRTLGDHRCPLLSIGSPAGTDPARTGFRSRLVADAFGAPVLRDQGPIRPAGRGEADHAASSSSSGPFRQCVQARARQAAAHREVDRGCPLDTRLDRPTWHASATSYRRTRRRPTRPCGRTAVGSFSWARDGRRRFARQASAGGSAKAPRPLRPGRRR